MATAGTDLLMKIIFSAGFIWIIWLFVSGGIGTAIVFSGVPWYAYAFLIMIVMMFISGKKK